MENIERKKQAFREFCESTECSKCPMDYGDGCKAYDILERDSLNIDGVVKVLKEAGVNIDGQN